MSLYSIYPFKSETNLHHSAKKILTISVQIYTITFIWQAHYQKEKLLHE